MKKEALFKLFLDNFDKEKKLLKYLTESELKKISSLPKFLKKIDENIFSQDSIIDTVHYSWFIPLLNIYSPKEASLFLLAMKPSYKKALINVLNLQDLKEELSPNLKEFLRSILLKSLIKKEDAILPINLLFDSKLNILLTLTKNELIKVINLLSMYDLAKELKQIIDKKKIKKIYSYLHLYEKDFLKTIYNKNEAFTTQKIHLDKFFEDKKKIRDTLHMLGLMRLSIALSGESIDLIWYVCHYLDIGRGNYIFKKCKKEKTLNVSNIITLEILKIINFLKPQK